MSHTCVSLHYSEKKMTLYYILANYNGKVRKTTSKRYRNLAIKIGYICVGIVAGHNVLCSIPSFNKNELCFQMKLVTKKTKLTTQQ